MAERFLSEVSTVVVLNFGLLLGVMVFTFSFSFRNIMLSTWSLSYLSWSSMLLSHLLTFSHMGDKNGILVHVTTFLL